MMVLDRIRRPFRRSRRSEKCPSAKSIFTNQFRKPLIFYNREFLKQYRGIDYFLNCSEKISSIQSVNLKKKIEKKSKNR